MESTSSPLPVGQGPGVTIPDELQPAFEAIKDEPIVRGRAFRMVNAVDIPPSLPTGRANVYLDGRRYSDEGITASMARQADRDFGAAIVPGVFDRS
jgi:hypothetical protein